MEMAFLCFREKGEDESMRERERSDFQMRVADHK